MRDILECMARNDLHEAMVRCWKLLRHDTPRFLEEEHAAHDPYLCKDYIWHKERVSAALLSNESLRIRNLPQQYPLAFLEALDEYLFEYFDCFGPAPPAQVSVDGNTYLIHRRVLRHSLEIAHGKKIGHLQGRLRHHWIIPAQVEGIQIIIRSASDCLYLKLSDCLQKEGLRIYVTSFPDGVGPHWLDSDPPQWTARELTDQGARWESVLESLEEARGEAAEIVIFPELTLCPGLRIKVVDWLDDNPDHPFLLILPGTFHQEKEGASFNIAELFDRFGKPLLSHRKLIPFGTHEKPEGIRTGNRIEMLDTPIGLISIPICLDFCEEGMPFNYLWEEIGAEWLLVPAFGNASSISAHLRRAKELYRKHGTISAVANQNPEGKDEDHGFVCLDAEKEPERATKGNRGKDIKISPIEK